MFAKALSCYLGPFPIHLQQDRPGGSRAYEMEAPPPERLGDEVAEVVYIRVGNRGIQEFICSGNFKQYLCPFDWDDRGWIE